MGFKPDARIDVEGGVQAPGGISSGLRTLGIDTECTKRPFLAGLDRTNQEPPLHTTQKVILKGFRTLGIDTECTKPWLYAITPSYAWVCDVGTGVQSTLPVSVHRGF